MKRNLSAVLKKKFIFNVSIFPKKLFALKLLEKYQFGNPQAKAPARTANPKY